MPQSKSLEELTRPARADRKRVPGRTDAHADTVATHKGAGRPVRRTDDVTIALPGVASPRVSETITATGPGDGLAVQQLATAIQRAPGAPASDASALGGELGQYELIREIGRASCRERVSLSV